MTAELGTGGAFVLGPARCGSTMLSETLNLHPGLLSVSEFLTMIGTRSLLPGRFSARAYWRLLSRRTAYMRRAVTPDTAPREFLYRPEMGRFTADNLPPIAITTLPHLTTTPDALFDALAERVLAHPRQTIEAHHAAAFETLKALCGGDVWVERSGASLIQARVLMTLFPAAKFVLMHRDGRDVALSLRAFPPARPMIWSWKWLSGWGPDFLDLDAPGGRSRWVAWTERYFSRIAPVDWMLRTPPPLSACAGFWSDLTLRTLPEFARLPPDRRHFLRYEQLTHDPHHEFVRLARFLGVDAPPEWLSRAARIPQARPPRWQSLDAETRRAISLQTEEARAALDAVTW